MTMRKNMRYYAPRKGERKLSVFISMASSVIFKKLKTTNEIQK